MLQLHNKALRPQPHLPVTPRFIIWLLVITIVLILLPTGISILQTNLTPAASVNTVLPTDATAALLRSENRNEREQAIQQLAQDARAGSTEAVDQLAAAFQRDTFLAINPESQSAQQVYMALGVTLGTSQLHTTPLGIFRSDDGGETS